MKAAVPQPSVNAGGVAFVTTNWSVVLAAQTRSPAADQALEKLCRAYWPSIYSFVRREGRSIEDSQDLTQGFASVAYIKEIIGLTSNCRYLGSALFANWKV